jgi:hypothetical protein
MRAQAGEDLNPEPVLPVVTARSNAMAKSPAKLVDGTESPSCVPIQSVMMLRVRQGNQRNQVQKMQPSLAQAWVY